MAKQREPEQVQSTFTFSSEAALNVLIADYRSAHERDHGTRLAMHGRRDLGAGKVMITFRVVDKAR
jgi:hypothetical protein